MALLNGAGEDALTETLGVVTPWNTAAGTTAVTAMQVQQVGTGILPGVALDTAAADALTANELTLQDSEKAHQGRAHRLCGWCIGRAGGG